MTYNENVRVSPFDATMVMNHNSRRSSKRFGDAFDIVTIAMMLQAMHDRHDIDLDYISTDDLTDFALEVKDSWYDYVKREQEEGRMWVVDWNKYIKEKIEEKFGKEEEPCHT